MYPVRRQISRHAARLRRDMTDVEKLAWKALRNRQLYGFKFRRQATVGPYIVDFLCIEAMLIVEIDGGQHDLEKDALRTGYLEQCGYRLLRFWNHEILENHAGVIESIVIALKERRPSPNPLPRKAGEG